MTPSLADSERDQLAFERALTYQARYGQLGAESALRVAIRELFPGRIALVSSFGAESAVLLDMVARIEPATPVIFLDTGKHFGETLRYRDDLVARLGLTDLRDVEPDQEALAREDADGLLFDRDPDRCCALRKVAPLKAALSGFEAWITGRKAFQAATRAGLPLFENDGPRVKVNPLRHWTPAFVADHFARHDLPRHPLEAQGFRSIGCFTCTARSAPAADPRAGRWAGLAKTECGIHSGIG